jgi:hypothetical protein
MHWRSNFIKHVDLQFACIHVFITRSQLADVLRFDTQQVSASGLPVAQGFLNSLSSHGRVAKLPHQGYIPGTY